MYERFRKLPLWAQFAAVMTVLIVAWALLLLTIGIIKALFPIAVLAAVIVALLQLYDKFRN
jgi:hypothetical protein